MNTQQVWEDAIATAKGLHAIKPIVETIIDNPVAAAMKMIKMEARIRELESKLNGENK